MRNAFLSIELAFGNLFKNVIRNIDRLDGQTHHIGKKIATDILKEFEESGVTEGYKQCYNNRPYFGNISFAEGIEKILENVVREHNEIHHTQPLILTNNP